MVGAKGSGAPRGNRNAVKHGGFTKDSIEQRAMLQEQIRQARKLLEELELGVDIGGPA
jgi:glucans biosynthesis protein